MVDFQNPVEIWLDYVALVRLCHAMSGLYIWEFFTTLHYEWNVIRRCHPYRWTIWIYSTVRLAALTSVIMQILSVNLLGRTECQVSITFGFIFAYVTLASSSLLIVLRVVAIWHRSKPVVVLAIGVWGICIVFFIQGIARVHSSWIPAEDSCSIPNIESNKSSMIAMLATDITLILTMLIGLLRPSSRGVGMLNLGRLLWKQGVIWLSIATVAEVPPVVFICLNLNGALDMMFLMPSLVIVSIASTRMYRSLTDFGSSPDAIRSPGNTRRSGRSGSALTSKVAPSNSHLPLTHLSVAVHTTYEEFSASMTNRGVILNIDSLERQPEHRADGLNLHNNDVEKGVQESSTE